MSWMTRMILGGLILRAPEGDGGGGGGGTPDPKPSDDPKDKQIAELTAKLAELEKKNTPDPNPKPDDKDLIKKAEDERRKKEAESSNSKALESALRFSMGAADWLKTNAQLLPKDIGGIFEAAEKETYDSALEKDSALKSGIVQSFFKVQENLDLLTAAQKNSVEDWLRLSKTGKEEKARSIYDTIFEPTFEMLKRVKKAQQLNKGGDRNVSDFENEYKDRLIKGSRKFYMGDKTHES